MSNTSPDPKPDAKTVRRRKDARPAEIIEAAAATFAKFGFAATNLEHVAGVANVSKGTIYRYFEDKDVLFARVIEAKLFDQLIAPPAMHFPAGVKAGDMLRTALLMAYHTGKQSHLADLVRVLLLEGERFAALRSACIERLTGLANEMIRAVLAHYDEGGRLTGSPYYTNPATIFFPIICAVALHGEMAGVAGFDMDAFVDAQLGLVCRAIDRLAGG